ncbi:MAG TPA: hypothetical protein VJR47_01405 [Stellaceae bacterium]|nr:hypothetical protein [Stellaceae bacterium]
MRKIVFLARRADIYCRRLNDGMTAIAVVLAVLTATLTLEQRLPSIIKMLQPIDPETGISMENF